MADDDVGAVQEALDVSRNEASKIMSTFGSSSSSSSSSSTSKQARTVMRNVAWLGAVVVGAAIALGYISVEFSPVLGGLAFAGMAGLAYALNEHDDSVSISFALTLVAVLLLLAHYVAPDVVLEALPFEIPQSLDPVHFAILVAFVVAAWWVIDIRFISRSGVKPDTVAKRLSSRIQDLFEAYAATARVGFLLGVGIGVIILNQMGIIAGDLVSMAGEAPYLAAELATIAMGYLALGGDVPLVEGIPVVENIGSTGFLFLSGLALVLAVGVKYAD